MKFILEIELGNETMQNADDIGHALFKLSRLLSGVNYGTEPMEVGRGPAILDDNGNTVGKWEVRESE